ncbi:MAG: LexA family transcriptional regulator [Blautia sp.]|nr:LexA family transcriptional regulator [Blautia sp.]
MGSLYNARQAQAGNLIGERIKAARKAMHMTQKEMCDCLRDYGVELSIPAVHKWEKGTTVPNAYQLFALCYVLQIPDGLRYFIGSTEYSSLPELDKEGLALLEKIRQLVIESERFKLSIPKNETKLVRMPFSYLRPSAGLGNFLSEENMEIREYPEDAVPDKADFAVCIDGDSMNPFFVDGQLIWIEKTQDLSPGDIGLFGYRGDCFIKIYQIREDEDDVFHEIKNLPVLVSYNKKYDPIVVRDLDSFIVFGRVVR